jgi:mannose-6-phosphate isomerase-like protein (cupin superfamily)
MSEPYKNLEHFEDNPMLYGVMLVIRDPRPGTPWGPFEVSHTEALRDGGGGVIQWEPGMEYRDRTLQRNDLLLHQVTGAVFRVMENLGQRRVSVTPWAEPVTEEVKQVWYVTEGRGTWMCWGQAFESERDIYKEFPGIHIPEDVPAEDFAEARMQTFRHPERQPWAQQYDIVKSWDKLSRKQRKRLRAQLRALLGVQKTVQMTDNIADLMEQNAIMEKRTKDGGLFKKWRMTQDKEEES